METVNPQEKVTAHSSLPPEDKKKANARSYLNTNIRRGVVKKQPCSVCGTMNNLEAHHFDYDKPLEVIWFCRRHHKEFHMKSRAAKEIPDSLSFTVIKRRFVQNMLILRRRNGLFQRDMAELFDINLQTYQAYEEARSFPPIDILLKAARHFKINLEVLLMVDLLPEPQN